MNVCYFLIFKNSICVFPYFVHVKMVSLTVILEDPKSGKQFYSSVIKNWEIFRVVNTH